MVKAGARAKRIPSLAGSYICVSYKCKTPFMQVSTYLCSISSCRNQLHCVQALCHLAVEGRLTGRAASHRCFFFLIIIFLLSYFPNQP